MSEEEGPGTPPCCLRTRLYPMGCSHGCHAHTWSTVACTLAGVSTSPGKLLREVLGNRPAGSQLLMWLAAWLTPRRCWRDGEIQWLRATIEVGRMPPLSRAFLCSLSSGTQWAKALAFQGFQLAARHGGVSSDSHLRHLVQRCWLDLALEPRIFSSPQ